MAGVVQGIRTEAFVVGGAKEADDGPMQRGGEVKRAAVVAYNQPGEIN